MSGPGLHCDQIASVSSRHGSVRLPSPPLLATYVWPRAGKAGILLLREVFRSAHQGTRSDVL
jgi:hypothetical protein